MEVKVNMRRIGLFLVGLLVAFAFAMVLYILADTVNSLRTPVRVLPWKPAAESPYQCYVVVQGTKMVSGIACLDTSLTH